MKYTYTQAFTITFFDQLHQPIAIANQAIVVPDSEYFIATFVMDELSYKDDHFVSSMGVSLKDGSIIATVDVEMEHVAIGDTFARLFSFRAMEPAAARE